MRPTRESAAPRRIVIELVWFGVYVVLCVLRNVVDRCCFDEPMDLRLRDLRLLGFGKGVSGGSRTGKERVCSKERGCVYAQQ